MEKMNILNIDELIESVATDANKVALDEVIQEFKREHYPNVLSKTKGVRGQFPHDENLKRLLAIIDAISHAEMGELKAAGEIIEQLYYDSSKKEGKDLIQLAELAFMSDYRLSRRIMTEAINVLENEGTSDSLTLTRCYLVLGEAEEHLQKYKRAIKYYQKGLNLFEDTKQQSQDKYMIIYLHFKIGMLNSTLQETDEAIHHFKKANDHADEQHTDIKVYSLVGLAKTYASVQMGDQAYPYLVEAIEIINQSPLTGSLTHAEALTELAFYYFERSKFEEAIPHYKLAIEVYLKQPQHSARLLGMIYMQYAYCLNHEHEADNVQAGKTYERAIELLEKADNPKLLENALADVIAFFDQTKNDKKKRYYEDLLVKNMNR